MKQYRLLLFLEKVKRLKRNSFLKLFLKSNKITYPAVQDPHIWPKIKGVSILSVDSFVLHFRYLIQDRDKLSNRTIYKYLDNQNLLSDNTRRKYELWQKQKEGEIKVVFNGQRYTHSEILYIVFYGGLAHLDEKYYKQFVNLANNPIGTGLIFHSFSTSIKNIFTISMSLVNDIKASNKALSVDS